MVLNHLGLAIECYFKAIPLLFSFRLRNYIIYSGLISFLLFAGLMISLWVLSASLATYFLQLLPYQPDWAVHILTWLVKIAGWFVILQFYKYIILIVLSPLLGILSEKIELYESGGNEIMRHSFWKSLPRSLKINVVNLLKEMALTLLLMLLSLVPGMVLITGPIILLLQFYFIGFGILDFYFERHLSYHATKEVVWKNLVFTLLTGFIFLLLFAIPMIGSIAAPLICTAASTLYMMSRQR